MKVIKYRSLLVVQVKFVSWILKNDRLLITNNIPYGATLNVKDGQKVSKGDVICTWDPYNNVIIAEINGTLKFENVIGRYYLP